MEAGPSRVSHQAIASLVLGLLGACTLGLSAVAGVVLGITALASINKSRGALRGRGLAAIGIAVSAMMLFVAPVIFLLVGMALPVAAKARSSARNIQTMAMIQQAMVTVSMYAADNDDRLPPADGWVEALRPLEPAIDALIAAPGDQVRGVAMNDQLGGVSMTAVRDPARTVLLFEIEPGGPLAGGTDLLPPSPRDPRGYLMVFVDGHTENVAAEAIGELIWEVD
jgi:hypothetical protein